MRRRNRRAGEKLGFKGFAKCNEVRIFSMLEKFYLARLKLLKSLFFFYHFKEIWHAEARRRKGSPNRPRSAYKDKDILLKSNDIDNQ
jgi:hypothetical protein